MSEYVEDTPVEEAPAEEAPAEEAPAEEAPAEEAPAEEAPAEEAVVEDTPVEEAPAEEAVVEDTPVEDAPAPAEEAVVEETPVEETPVEEAPVEDTPVEEAPVEEAVVEEAPVEEAVVEEAPVEEAAVEEAPITSLPIEQVANDIREILSTPSVVSESVEMKSSELSDISLATLIRVLGQWSGGDIRKRHVESELLSGTEKDENLDNVEKMVEILKLWIQEGDLNFKNHENYFKNIDEYTLVGESKNWSEEKKKDVLLQIIELTIDVSNRRLTNDTINSVVNYL